MISAVDGWCSVEELTRWGFAHAQVVMANEAHDGLKRCIRTREVGIRMIRVAHEAGVRRLAMEALPWPDDGSPGPIWSIPAGWGGYLAQPDMRRLMTAARDLGWSLWAYEAVMEVTAHADPAEFLTLEHSNWRDREQARNLCRVLAAAPAEPLLVWTGGGHASKEPTHGWVTMGCHFPAMSGTDPFVIDQDVTVDFTGRSESWVQKLLSSLGGTLDAFGGTAGILRDQAPPPLNARRGVDALIISTDNALILRCWPQDLPYRWPTRETSPPSRRVLARSRRRAGLRPHRRRHQLRCAGRPPPRSGPHQQLKMPGRPGPRDLTSEDATTASKSATPRPSLWTKLSVARGNLIQTAGLATGTPGGHRSPLSFACRGPRPEPRS